MKYKLSKLQSKVLAKADAKSEIYKALEDADTGDEVFDRIKALVSNGQDKIIKTPKFQLSPEEMLAIHDSIVEVIESGESPEQIATWIVSMLQEKLDDIKGEATNRDGPKGAVFRRSEQ